MPKKIGIICVIFGAVLIISALLLFFYNQYEDYRAGQEAESLLSDIKSVIAEKNHQTNTTSEHISDNAETELSETAEPTEETEETSAEETPIVMIKGYDYIGIISIPKLEIELPVMADWDYTRLKFAPCRQFGSSKTDDLVIAAHNYRSHFGNLHDLEFGDSVEFTDMEGNISIYSVESIQVLNATNVDAVQNSDYDLVLYTCTKIDETRLTVFCNRSDN